MSLVLSFSRAVGRADRAAWLPALGWFGASAAVVTLAVASMPAAGWESLAAATTSSMAAPPNPRADTDAINHRNPVRCHNCGIVEHVRSLPFAAAEPRVYELTVRFRDGSRRLSKHTDDASWRAGDPIMLMGGAQLADRM